MNEVLTQHFLSMKWDKNYLTQITSVSEDTIVSVLDSVLPEWASEITDLKEVKGESVCSVALYLPGRIRSGLGTNDYSAICNIINRMKSDVNDNPVPKTTPENVTNQQSVSQQQSIQNFNQNFFNNFMSSDGQTNNLNVKSDQNSEPKKEEPEFVDFNSPEAQAMEKEFWQHGTIGMNPIEPEKKEEPITATPQEVNPTGQPIPRSAWTQENGLKLKNWMSQHNVTNIEQMNNWLMKYCGLDYDHFNPEYTDKFIAWTNAVREKQTY